MHLNVNNIIIVPWTPSLRRNMLKHLGNYLCRLNLEHFRTGLPHHTLYDLSRPMVNRLNCLLPDAKGINKLLPLSLRWLTILPYGDPIEEALAMDTNSLATRDLSDADGVINCAYLV